MGLEVGGIYTTAGVRVDDSSFTRLERRMDSARQDARRPIEGEARLDVDERGFRRMERNLNDTERKSKRFSSGVRASMGAVRLGIAGAAAAGGAALGALGLKTIGAASDIEESLSKNRVLFGDHAKSVEQFAETSAKSYGIARGAALEYTGTFGNLFRALGVSREESAKTSVELTKLAADMASFNNSTPEEALEALRSGLVGETEPLRRFGVNINDAALRSEALKLGLVKTTKEALDPQAKAMAAVALATKQTSAAHGDFERTSGGLANQTRILKARLADAGAELGARLLPIALKVVRGLNSLGDAGDKAGGVFRRVRSFIGDLVGAFRGGDEGATRFAGRLRRAFETVRDFIVTTFARVARVFKGSGDDFRALGQGFVAVANRIMDGLEPLMARVLPGMGDAIEGVAKIVRGVVRIVGGLLTGDWKRAWKGAKDVVSGVLSGIGGLLRATNLGGLLQAILNTVVGLVNGVIGVINKLPGVNIGKVSAPNIAGPRGVTSGPLSGSTVDRRTRGYFAGGIVDAPIAIVGEEAPEHPEVIIPSNPRYRGRAIDLWREAGRMIGIPGFRTGGIRGAVKDAAGDLIKSAGNPVAALVGRGVTSAADLIGDLPANPFDRPFTGLGTYALDKAKDYIREKVAAAARAVRGAVGGGGNVTGLLPAVQRALAFARSHGWGGSVISGWRSRAEQAILYARWLAGTGNRAAPPGQSNHEGGQAVDVSDTEGFARAMEAMGAGRLYRRVPGEPWHFSITGFRKGGKRGKRKTPKPILAGPDLTGIARSLRRGDRGIPRFEQRIQDLERTYGQRDREFGLTDEDLVIENDDGSVTVNTEAVNARSGELEALRKIRARIAQTITRYRERVARMITEYRAAIATLESALGAAKGKARKKERAGYTSRISDYRQRIGELQDVAHDLGFDTEDARIDLAELGNEIAAVRGTTGQPAPADEAGAGSNAGSTAEDPDARTLAAAATARADALAQDLAAVRGNLAAFTGSGDLGSALGGSAWGSALADAYGAGGTAGPRDVGILGGDGAAPTIVNVHYNGFTPPSGAELEQMGDGVVEALRSRPARPVTHATVGG